MFSCLARLATLALLVLLVGGCGSSGNDRPAINNIGTPGCTAAPDCSGCATCTDRCLCSVGDLAGCNQACGVVGAGGGGGAFGVGGSGNTGGGVSGAGGGQPPVERFPAVGARVAAVNIYQGVEIPLMQGGVEIPPFERNAPVVARRPAMLRIFMDLDATFQARDLVVSLELVSALNPGAQEQPRFVTAPSNPLDFGSTFNFDIPPELMTEDLAYRIRVLEAMPGLQTPGDASGAEFPIGGGAAGMVPFSVFGPLRVTIVPVINNGIIPDTSPGRVQQYHDFHFKLYPTEAIEMNVRAPIDPQSVGIGPVGAQGNNWGETLSFVQSVRSGDGVDSRTYYYGVLTPTNSIRDYCGFGCVAGLGGVPPPQSSNGRVSVGLGFFPDGSGNGSPETMAHEVGHSLGREHAPCQAPDAPPGYPYPGGGIGVTGFDILTRVPVPTNHFDIMGYCEPNWISDFNYKNLFDRISFVNQFGHLRGVEKKRYQVLIVDFDGSLKWGFPVEMADVLSGPKREIETLDLNGNVVGEVEGFFEPFDHLDGGMLYVEDETVAKLSLSPGVASLKPTGVGTSAILPLTPR